MSAGAQEGIHPSAVIERGARIGDGASVGAFTVVGPEVEIGAGAWIGSHVHLRGRTVVGPRVRIFPFASVGEIPQDLKYRGEDSELIIGADTVIREHVTIHTGTSGGGGVTRVGSRCLVMVGVHVAHDCVVGDQVILANGVGLGGHVVLGDHVVMGAMCGVHQFCRIGPHAMVGALSAVDADVPPYSLCMGNRARLEGLNLVGLRRRGFPADAIQALQRAYRELFDGSGPVADRAAQLLADLAVDAAGATEVGAFADFVASARNRPLMRAARG